MGVAVEPGLRTGWASWLARASHMTVLGWVAVIGLLVAGTGILWDAGRRSRPVAYRPDE